MGSGDGVIGLAFLAHPLRPDAVGQMHPVLVPGFEFFPACFQIFSPFGQAKELMEQTGGDEHPIIQVGFIKFLYSSSIA